MTQERVPTPDKFVITTPEQVKETVDRILDMSETNPELAESLQKEIIRKVADLISVLGSGVRSSPFYHALAGSSQRVDESAKVSDQVLKDTEAAVLSFVNKDLLPELRIQSRLPETPYLTFIIDHFNDLDIHEQKFVTDEMNQFLRKLQKQYPLISLRQIPEASYFIGGGDYFVGDISPENSQVIGDAVFENFRQLLNLISFNKQQNI